MSDADPEAVTVSADGVTVRKTVDTEQFQTLAVVVELASERDDESRVQLVDQIPTDVPMEDVGFHPQYGSEHWSVDEGSVAFERDFEPGEAYTTVYGIRDYPSDAIDALLTEPQLGLVEVEPDSIDEVVEEERSEVVRDFISGEADLPGLEGEITAEAAAAAAEAANALSADDAVGEEAESAAGAEAAVDPEPEPATEGTDEKPESESTAEADPEPEPAVDADAEPEPAAEEPTDTPSEPVPGTESSPEPEPTPEPDTMPEPEPAAEPDLADAEDEVSEEADAVRVPLTGGVVRVLIKELREGDVDSEDRQLLRDALLGTEGTTEARISHLQKRVSDLEAYADALEAFIDEEGSAEAIIQDLRDDVARIERQVHTVDDQLDEVVEDVGQMDHRLRGVADDVASVRATTDDLANRIDDTEDDVTAVDERVDALDGRLDAIATDVDGLDSRLSDVDGRIGDLQDGLESTHRDLQADIDALAGDLEDFDAFRDRLTAVFGGGGGSLGEQDAGDEGSDDQ